MACCTQGLPLLITSCPVILLRNLDPSQGLCNGTHMVITRMGDQVLEACLIGGEHSSGIVFIPRISLIPTGATDLTFQASPVPGTACICSQYQQGLGTVSEVCWHLSQDPGLCTWSTLRSSFLWANIKVLLPSEGPDMLELTIHNIVYNKIPIDWFCSLFTKCYEANNHSNSASHPQWLTWLTHHLFFIDSAYKMILGALYLLQSLMPSNEPQIGLSCFSEMAIIAQSGTIPKSKTVVLDIVIFLGSKKHWTLMGSLWLALSDSSMPIISSSPTCWRACSVW